ncbi:hypothetical protein MANES_02G012350v8 [Manihot esculenta]|uniref:Uncharacterized protein n=1 Tax=Manihot esculenta TaxID=3983 RepID=A0ACB7I2C9_MANES|nr:hypothetical protein MANES_02G012350v8 [Manihot esculenta]
MEEEKGKEQELQKAQGAAVIWDCGSPLYDSYEVASLFHIIDRHTMTLPFSPSGSNRFIFRPSFQREEKSLNVIKKEGVHHKGLLPKLMSSLLWTRRREKGTNENARHLSFGFYSLCGNVGLCGKKTAKVKKIMPGSN